MSIRRIYTIVILFLLSFAMVSMATVDTNRIQNLYTNYLNRQADNEELYYWSRKAKSIATVRTGIIESEERRELVNQLYIDYLDREGDYGGLEHWSKSDLTVSEIINKALCTSSERTNLITKIYQNLLNRKPNKIQINNLALHGGTVKEIVKSIESSDQYKRNQNPFGLIFNIFSKAKPAPYDHQNYLNQDSDHGMEVEENNMGKPIHQTKLNNTPVVYSQKTGRSYQQQEDLTPTDNRPQYYSERY